MAKKKINVGEVIESSKKVMREDTSISPSVKAVFENLLELVVAFSNRYNLGSDNSSKPPSQDPNRKKKTRTAKGQKRKPGGQE